jgi:hypothetical protein
MYDDAFDAELIVEQKAAEDRLFGLLAHGTELNRAFPKEAEKINRPDQDR